MQYSYYYLGTVQYNIKCLGYCSWYLTYRSNIPCCMSMERPWVVRGQPILSVSQQPMRCPSGIPRDARGISGVYVVRGPPMGCPWEARGQPVGCPGSVRGVSIGRTWRIREASVRCRGVSGGCPSGFGELSMGRSGVLRVVSGGVRGLSVGVAKDLPVGHQGCP